GDPRPGRLALVAARAPGRGGAGRVPARAAAAARGARRPPPLAARRDARPVPLLRLPLAGDGDRAPRAREHAPPPARPGGAADGPRPRIDGGPGRPLHRAAVETVGGRGIAPIRGRAPR